MFRTWRGGWRARREPTPTQGGHTSPPQKGPRPDMNPAAFLLFSLSANWLAVVSSTTCFQYCFLFSTRCLPCACHPVGSVNGSCHADSGDCTCKLLVVGNKCDVCQPGASHLDTENHFGCSKGGKRRTHVQKIEPSVQNCLLAVNVCGFVLSNI